MSVIKTRVFLKWKGQSRLILIERRLKSPPFINAERKRNLKHLKLQGCNLLIKIKVKI
jgi:hypothetical protein